MANQESYAGKINRKLNKKLRIISVAAGRENADLVLKNAAYVNVFSGEICHADIAVAEGLIVGMGEYSGAVEYDMTGKLVLPGFVDAHIHLESSLVSPREFAKAVLPHGTTTVITDPHEIANVMGTDGIEYMLQATEDLPVDAAELSTVFANALENAIHAVKQLPSEQRVIRCKYIRHPQLMFRVANPSTKEKFPLTSLDALSTPAIPTALAPAALLPTAKNTAPSVSTEPEMAGLPYRSSSRFGLTVFIRLYKNERPSAMHKG